MMLTLKEKPGRNLSLFLLYSVLKKMQKGKNNNNPEKKVIIIIKKDR